jgi:hypothetical protein
LKRQRLSLPPDVARAFWVDLRAYFAEENQYKQDEIALKQLHALKEHQSPCKKPLRLSDVKATVRRDEGDRRLMKKPIVNQPEHSIARPRSKSGQLVSCQNLGGMLCVARNLVRPICVNLICERCKNK